MTKRYYREVLDSPVGKLTLIASEKGIRALLWEGDTGDRVRIPERFESEAPPFVKAAKQQLEEYFDGKRTRFDVPLDPQGTPFQLAAWKALSEIPYGKTVSYEAQAKRLGSAKLARAVGSANRRNPLSILVPCHRVVGKSGALVGFAAGLQVKQFLLSLESAKGDSHLLWKRDKSSA